MSLAQARGRREEARKLLAQTIDPGDARQAAKAAKLMATASSFEAVAREWHEKFSPSWVEDTRGRVLRCMEKDLFPDSQQVRACEEIYCASR